MSTRKKDSSKSHSEQVTAWRLPFHRFLPGLGIAFLAGRQRCQLHRTFIGSVERGERNLSILNLRLIAKILRVSLAGLLNSLV